jgi:hypothetical protein
MPSLKPVWASETMKELSENESLERFYSHVSIGEKHTENYHGPIDSRSQFNPDSGALLFLDEQFSNQYLNEEIQPEAMDLHSFWFKKVMDKSNCPDATLGQNIDYIRYLYRLLSISYLFESMKLNNKTARELSADKNICAITYDDLFAKCKPQSDDMKKFQERVYGKFVNEKSKFSVPALDKEEVKKWLESFHHSTSLTLDPVYARLHDWCLSKKVNCRNLTVSDLKAALGTICQSDKNLIQNLCAEKDNLYGLSYAEKATELIESSNAFKLINHSGMGEECLRRYVKLFSPKEVRYSSLNRQYPLIFSQLIRTNSRYPQGDLFLPGALKEFDMKGLSDFLVALKPPKVETKVVIISKPKPKPAPRVVVAPKPVIAAAPEAVIMTVPVPAKPKVSEFESRLAELDTKSLDSLSLNMEAFRDDFEFTPQMISDLSGPIKKFQTRAALSDMKAYDNLGSIEAPVGLVFLKYLIDTENHQGLFNIITVLSNKFYVNNDIEKIERPVLIELRNDSTTNNHWQILLLKNKSSKK